MDTPYPVSRQFKNEFSRVRAVVIGLEFFLLAVQAAVLLFYPTYASRIAAVGAGLICAIALSVGWTALLFWQAGQPHTLRRAPLSWLPNFVPYFIPALFVLFFSILWVVD